MGKSEDKENWKNPPPPLADIEIVFENRFFVIADKPPGMLSVPSRWGEEDPRKVLGKELEAKLNFRLWPVHRLDLDVSGLVIFSKNPEAHKSASQWFQNKEIQKTYETWCEGSSKNWRKSGWNEWNCKLLRGKKRVYEDPKGELSLTRALYKEDFEFEGTQVEAWQMEPLTGKPHQLRYEMFRHGMPMLGDELYGAKIPFRAGAIALRAVSLDFSKCRDKDKWSLPGFIGVETLRSAMKRWRESISTE